MATYTQPGAKRQKVRERIDNIDYFQGVDKMEYNNSASHTDCSSYRHYSPTERMHSRTMEEWLKFSVSLTEFRYHGSDHRPPPNRPWDDGTNSLDNHKRCVKALFDLMSKINVKYWTAFDTDLIPYSDNFEESKAYWDDMSEFVQELSQKYHVKLLWLAPDLHSRARYASGALTSPDAASFIQAATQIKKCLEVGQRWNAECFLLWPHREGYSSLFQSDVQKEIKLFAKLLKMTAEYKERLNYRCQLLIMPYYNCNSRNYSCNYGEDTINSYMWDVTSCLYMLKSYNLERYYRVCCEPGHHMIMANAYNMLGGVFVSSDGDERHCDRGRLTLMMKCILDQGSPPPGGVSLRLCARGVSDPRDPRDTAAACARAVDRVARALRVAARLLAEHVFTKHLQQRYATYQSGFGSRIVTADVSLEECEDYHKKNQCTSSEVVCSKSEQMEMVFQRYLDACDHV